MENYQPNDMPDHLVSPRKFKQPSLKRETFMVSVPKITAHVPGAGLYETTCDCGKNKIEKNQKISKSPKNSFIDQIYKSGKSPEKSSPSPSLYKNLESWRKSDRAHRISGTINVKEARVTFVEEKILTANDTPGFKYKDIPSLVSPIYDRDSCSGRINTK